MVILLGTEALRRRDALWAAGAALAGLLFCSFMLWLVPHGAGRFELGQSGGQMALSAVYPAIGAAFLAVTGTVAFQAFRNDPRRRRSTPVLSSRRAAAYDYVNR